MRLVLLSSQRMRIIVTEGLYIAQILLLNPLFLMFKKEGNEQIFGFCGLLILLVL